MARKRLMKLNAIMTATDIRTSINNGLAGFTPEMLLVVDDFVKSLRRRMVEPAEDSPVFPDMDKEFYSPEEAYGLVMKDINAEERAYWAQSIERDMADIASGKPRKYVSGDEFWSRFEEAVEKHYEDVQA